MKNGIKILPLIENKPNSKISHKLKWFLSLIVTTVVLISVFAIVFIINNDINSLNSLKSLNDVSWDPVF